MHRIQLTLFIEGEDAENIERVRSEYNPEQHALIKSHVTLCREDELGDVNMLVLKLSTLNYPPIIIHFDHMIRVSDGKGVMIPGIGPNNMFHALRKAILKPIDGEVRLHAPHITLMHPRNSTCTDIKFEQISSITFPHSIQFNKISLIEQEENQPWKVLREFPLCIS